VKEPNYRGHTTRPRFSQDFRKGSPKHDIFGDGVTGGGGRPGLRRQSIDSKPKLSEEEEKLKRAGGGRKRMKERGETRKSWEI